MAADPRADFRRVHQPKNSRAEGVPYVRLAEFHIRRMKAEPCVIGKASPVLRQQTQRQCAGREAFPGDDDPLTAHLQIQVSGDVSKDFAAPVILDEYIGFGLRRVAGNTRKY